MDAALHGIRVIDFGQYLAGPLLSVMLADNGADVIRIDPPGGPRWRHPANAMLQRGKRSVVLDLALPGDLRVARELVTGSDVLVENFRPGVMDRLGIGAAEMLEQNPRLIYCSLPGFAEDDPRAGMRAWEGVVCAAVGVYHASVRHDDEGPVFNAIPFASSYAAAIAAHSVLAALIARQRDGLGQRIQVPLFEALFEFQGHLGQKLPSPPRQMPKPGSGNWAPVGHFRCADGRWVHLGQVQERHYRWFTEKFLPAEALARGLGDPGRLRADPALNAEALRVLAESLRDALVGGVGARDQSRDRRVYRRLSVHGRMAARRCTRPGVSGGDLGGRPGVRRDRSGWLSGVAEHHAARDAGTSART